MRIFDAYQTGLRRAIVVGLLSIGAAVGAATGAGVANADCIGSTGIGGQP
jgi:hypothetical protein